MMSLAAITGLQLYLTAFVSDTITIMASVVALSIALPSHEPNPATADKAYPFRRTVPGYDNKIFLRKSETKEPRICWAFSAADLYSEELCLGPVALRPARLRDGPHALQLVLGV